MRLRNMILRVGTALMLVGMQCAMTGGKVIAEGSNGPQLVISQFKVTTNDGQFFTLYNPSLTASVDLGGFQLQYFNNNDLTKATSSKIIPLSGTLAPMSYYMLSDGASTICYQVTVATVSLSFSSTSGFAEILQLPPQTTVGNLVVPTVIDYVGWSKKTTSGNDMLTVSPAATSITIPSATSSSLSWMRQLPVQGSGANGWLPVRPDPKNACSLQLVQSGSTTPAQPVTNPGNKLTTGQQPPATIVDIAPNDSDATADAPMLPAADVGLASPQITELLPNPSGSGNDDTDEFIELYNPNTVQFDLSGFILQTGTTTKHSYEFPDDTMLAPHAFTAFQSADTGLSLSNTSGQAGLLDPFGNSLSQTEPYTTAKDGQTWALANGKWQWTTEATPNAANIIKQPVAATKGSSKTNKVNKTTSGSGTTANTSSAVKGAATTTNGSHASGTEQTTTTPIHPLVLAVVGALAVGYGIYEYRHDIANRLYEFRRNRKLGRAARV